LGSRVDAGNKPEYIKGMYEFKAPASYDTEKWKHQTFYFVIDVSSSSIQNGFVPQILASIKNSLDYFSVPGNTNIGFITYNTSIHYYSWQSETSSEPFVIS